jgi:hypothetical protein
MKTRRKDTIAITSILGAVLLIILWLSASSLEYNEYLYDNIPDSTLIQVYDNLEIQGFPATKQNIIQEYKQLLKQRK